MKDYSDKDELDFIESLYNEAEDQLKDIYKEEKQNRDELLQSISNILLTYTISNDVMSMTKQERDKEYIRISKIITTFSKKQAKLTEDVITNILTNTINNTYNFYSYNAKLTDVEKIINENFKGKHFSERVWNNETEVAKQLHRQTQEFLKGKINVNQIKKDIETTFNTSAYNSKRLTETEISRCSNSAFDRFCIETNVKKLRYVATLDGKLCSDCGQYHDKIFDLNNKIELPRHPMCRCFYTIEQ